MLHACADGSFNPRTCLSVSGCRLVVVTLPLFVNVLLFDVYSTLIDFYIYILIIAYAKFA